MIIDDIVLGLRALKSISGGLKGHRVRLFEEKLDPALKQLKEIHDDFMRIISEIRDASQSSVDSKKLQSLARKSRESNRSFRRLFYEEARVESRHSIRYVVHPILRLVSEEDVEYIKQFYRSCYEYFHSSGTYYHEIANLTARIDILLTTDAYNKEEIKMLLLICDECAESLNKKWSDVAKSYAVVKARLV